jgi:hypothetical protein
MGSGSSHVRSSDPYQGQDPGAFQFPGGREWGYKLEDAATAAGAGAAGAAASGEDWRNQQQGLADQLRQTAAGQGQSAAQKQMMAGIQRSQAMAQSQAAGNRGVSSGLAQYLAGQQGAASAADITQQAGVLRAQESAQAQAQLGQLLGQARGQDVQLEGMRSGLVQQFMQMGMSKDQAQMQANMQLEAMRQQAYQHAEGLEAGTYSYSPGTFESGGAGWDFLNAGAGVASALIPLSDKREKKNIKDLSTNEMDNFISSLKGYSFNYKESSGNFTSPEDKKTKQFGIMAQDLQNTSIGKGAVRKVKESVFDIKPAKPTKTKERLMIDTQKLTMSLAAALGRVGQRRDDI